MGPLLRGVAIGACLASCHLAETIDPKKCDPGFHNNNGHCDADPADGPSITIAAATGGTSCAGDPAAQRPPVVSPDSITVTPNGSFRFTNDDTVDHTITGDDGQTWVSAKAGESSSFMGITKAGSWNYHVSGCAKGGVIVVQ